MSSKKNRYTYVGVSFIILIFGIIFVPEIIQRIKSGNVIKNELNPTQEHGEPLSYLEINGSPKKVPSFSFTNHNGELITDKDYLGKVYIVEFFFTTCPTICPKMNANLVQIQNTFKHEERFGIASFTINPKYDTPDVLKSYAEKHKATHANWHFMTGNRETIYALANQGFNIYAGVSPEAEGGFEHSGNFALIDKKGFIRSRKDSHGNPLIFYNGIVSEKLKVDDEGHREEISLIKEDIRKLLHE